MVPMIIDPTGAFGGDSDRLIRATGIIASFLDVHDTRSAKEQFESNYWFFFSWDKTGHLDADGTFHYPGDPPFYPLVRIPLHEETVFIYMHALVAVRASNGEWWWTRMD